MRSMIENDGGRLILDIVKERFFFSRSGEDSYNQWELRSYSPSALLSPLDFGRISKMVVHYNALLDLQLPGIQSVRPVDGWPSIRSYKLRLRCHECSELLQFKEISLGSYNAAKKKRFLRRPIPCPNCCSRDGEVFANEFRGTISGDKIILMRFQADGLQPEDGFIKLDGPLIATDLQGNNSEEFYLELNGEPDGIHINVDFQDAAGHRRRIEGRVKVIFQRLRL